MHNDISQNLVSVEYKDNNRIQIFKINSMTREAVDTFVETIQTEYIDKDGQVILAIHDFRNVGGVITPYFVNQVQEFSRNEVIINSRGRAAVLISTDVFRVMINPLVKIFMLKSNFAIKFFTNFDQAVNWVAEYEE